MNDIARITSTADNTEPLTLDKMLAAIEALQRKPIFPEDHPFHGVFEIKECAALKGSQAVIINGETAYYSPDAFELKEVKVLKLPELKLPNTLPEINFSWEFQSSPINWEL
jgi:hypothetical protein